MKKNAKSHESFSEQGKLDQLCRKLKDKTLEPALSEAQKIKDEAQLFAKGLIDQAHKERDQIIASAQTELDRQKKAFESALETAKTQVISGLQQEIETAVFNPEIKTLIVHELKDEKLLKKIIEALVVCAKDTVEKGAHIGDLMLSKGLSEETVAKVVSQKTLEAVKGKVIQLPAIQGGAKLKIEEKNLTLDLSDEAIEELLFSYMRKEFRDLVFNQESK